MRRWVLAIILLCLLIPSARAADYEPPPLQGEAADYLPEQQSNILSGFLELMGKAINAVIPESRKALGRCAGVLAISILCSLLPAKEAVHSLAIKTAGALSISLLLLQPANLLISEAVDSISQMAEHSKLLLPVMTGALAASGGSGKAAAAYMGTAFFNSILFGAIEKVLIPFVYMQLALAVAAGVSDAPLLKKLQELTKTWVSWGLKALLGLFSAYMAVTGAISGSADALALKAAKLTISGAVPVAGGMLADAAETILVSAAALRSAAGLGGLFAVLAITAGPFLRSGIQYCLIKLTGTLCAISAGSGHHTLVDGIGQAFGITLGLMGTAAMLQLISIACFMKGVSL